MSRTNTNSTASGGIGFTSLLAIAFIALKLVGVIDWSWWWVLAPLWVPAAIVLVVTGQSIGRHQPQGDTNHDGDGSGLGGRASKQLDRMVAVIAAATGEEAWR